MLKNQVVELLESYMSRETKIKLLTYEMKRLPRVSPHEMLEAMALSAPEGVGGLTGHISDTTMQIALNYSDVTMRTNLEGREDLLAELTNLETIHNRLTYYVDLLPERERSVIQAQYFYGKTLQEISAEMEKTPRTIQSYRKVAIENICKMYRFASRGKHDIV